MNSPNSDRPTRPPACDDKVGLDETTPDRPSTVLTGHRGEDFAVEQLVRRGYRIVERNWRPGGAARGEIDCIAWDGKVLCFIEIKTRASNEYGAPQEAVHRTKQRQICALANGYVSRLRLSDTACRFDVVEVWMTPGPTEPRLALHRNAFDYQPPGGRRGARVF